MSGRAGTDEREGGKRSAGGREAMIERVGTDEPEGRGPASGSAQDKERDGNR